MRRRRLSGTMSDDLVHHVIYMVINKSNGKMYIGKTKHTAQKRWKTHQYSAGQKRFQQIYFYKAIRKWGIEGFDVCVIDQAESMEESDFLEQYYILEYESYKPKIGYNGSMGGCGVHPTDEIRQKISDTLKGKTPFWITKGVPHPMKGKRHSEETRALISKSKTGIPCPEHIKEKQRTLVGVLSPTYGYRWTDEQKKGLSETLTGRRLTEEWKINIGLASARRTHSEETKKIMSDTRMGKANPMFGKCKEQHPRYKTDIAETEVRALRESGMNILAISKQFGVSRNVIYGRLGIKTWK